MSSLPVNKQDIFWLSLLLLTSACLNRTLVKRDSEKIPKADFVEVSLASGKKVVLKNVRVHENYLEGEHRDNKMQIDFSKIHSVEIINRDYGKFLAWYVWGGIAASLLLIFVYDHLLYQ